MRPKTVTVSTEGGTSSPVVLDQYISPFNVGLYLTADVSSSSTVQYTLDDPFGTYSVSFATSAHWVNHPELTNITASTTAKDSNIAFPVRAVRLKNNSLDTTGSVSLTILQAGMPS